MDGIERGGGSYRKRGYELLRYGLVAASVWIAWEAVKVPFVERAPPAMALRLAPSSPALLSRAAEAEFAAERYENASDLADLSLQRAPFNVRALRVKGLVQARSDAERADQTLTLAGNWSLRDDPSHSWLIQRRLQTGQITSAFAHADTLARRRQDLYPAVFPLFTAAASADPRALSILANLLGESPSWRGAYLNDLLQDQNQIPTLASLIVTMQQTRTPITDDELRVIYLTWSAAGRFPALAAVRDRTKRPAAATLVNGDFNLPADEQLVPFGWRMGVGSGVTTNIVEDDLREGNRALRVEYDGFGNVNILEQLLFLTPGSYRLSADQRTETPEEGARFDWRVRCVGTNNDLIQRDLGPIHADWQQVEIDFEVPRGCANQWLILQPRAGDRRTRIAAWFDSVKIAER